MADLSFPDGPAHGAIKIKNNLTHTWDSDYSVWKVTDFQNAPTGPAATVAIGTVTTLDSDQSATVVNVGDSADAVLNFGIPQGVAGVSTGVSTGKAIAMAIVFG